LELNEAKRHSNQTVAKAPMSFSSATLCHLDFALDCFTEGHRESDNQDAANKSSSSHLQVIFKSLPSHF